MTNQQNENNANLPENADDATITPTATEGNAGAVPSGTEETTAKGLEAIIAQQNEVIAALQEQLATSNDNLIKAIRQGAAFTDSAQQAQTPNNAQTGQIGMMPQTQQSMNEPYVPLKEMDFSISKNDMMK